MSTESFDDVFARDDATPATPAPEADTGIVRDEVGRFAPKADPAANNAAPEQTTAPEPTEDTRNANRHVPLSELLAERDRFKKEKSLREEFEKRAAEHESRAKTLEQMFQAQRQPQQQPQQAQPQQQAPDPYSDPEGWAAHIRQQIVEDQHNLNANRSERRSRKAHGDALVNEAVQAAIRVGAAQHFFRADDPYEELINWHKSQQALQRIGPDPDAYEKSVETKLREKILAELKAGGTKPQQRFPGSLADATAAGAGGQHLTDQAVADELFSTTRNRRA